MYMVKIHWSIYIIIGAGILFTSYYIPSHYEKVNLKSFTLFLAFGYLFLIVGVAKLGIWFVSRRNESPIERRDVRRGMHYNQFQKQRAMRSRAVRYCYRCGSGLSGYENFCPICGQRVR